MKTVQDIIDAYRKDWHIVDGLLIKEIQRQWDEAMLEILIWAKGRDIIVDEDAERIDGQWYKYDGQEDPNFDIEKYIS